MASDRTYLLPHLTRAVKGLLIKLYGSEEAFIKATPTKLEQLLLEYDNYAGNQEYVRTFIITIGLPIIDVDLDIYFLATIDAFLSRGQDSCATDVPINVKHILEGMLTPS